MDQVVCRACRSCVRGDFEEQCLSPRRLESGQQFDKGRSGLVPSGQKVRRPTCPARWLDGADPCRRQRYRARCARVPLAGRAHHCKAMDRHPRWWRAQPQTSRPRRGRNSRRIATRANRGSSCIGYRNVRAASTLSASHPQGSKQRTGPCQASGIVRELQHHPPAEHARWSWPRSCARLHARTIHRFDRRYASRCNGRARYKAKGRRIHESFPRKNQFYV